MKNNVLSGVIGALVVILCLFVVCVFFEPFNIRTVYIINPEKVINNDSITCSQITVLNDLENKGLLLTPHEYTSRISNYYTTLVAFLIGLFVLFTIGSIYSIRLTSRKEIDDAKRDLDIREEEIKKGLKKNIQDSLSELLKDSISFKETVVSAIYGRIEDELVTRADKENVDNKLLKIQEDISFLYETVNEFSEQKSSDEEIE